MLKKLIEAALPLQEINEAAAREKSIRHGHPSTLHLWWARRPLAAARAVIFAQMVNDPAALPDKFPTEEEQKTERERLFAILKELVIWENTTNEKVLERARQEIRRSWAEECRAAGRDPLTPLPAFHDPFAGGGSLPLEAQRLGLESYASDLNPVAVLINKAMIEIPPKFAGRPPVSALTSPPAPLRRRGETPSPSGRVGVGSWGERHSPPLRGGAGGGVFSGGADDELFAREWRGARGLAEDVRRYGEWMRDEAFRRIGHLYPPVEITPAAAEGRPDLTPFIGQQLTVIAWLWARTVRSPNPAFQHVAVPLASTFMLSTKKGKEAYVEPVVEGERYRFVVKNGVPRDQKQASSGTKAARGANFVCLLSGTPIEPEYIKSEGRAGRMGARLMAIVAEGKHGRVYLPPTDEMENIARQAQPIWIPDTPLPDDQRNFWTVSYGLAKFGDIFTPRQLVALTTFSELVQEARERVLNDASAAGWPDDGLGLEAGGSGATAYADAVAVYLAFLINQVANHSSTVCGWNSANAQMRSVFARQAIPMVWDYAESNPFCDSSGSFNNLFERQIKGFDALSQSLYSGKVQQYDAASQMISREKIISTDPPYYDNIGYADLSDFFYVWLRRTLRPVFPDLLATLTVPKTEELIASPYRHGGRAAAEQFFLDGMSRAMQRLAEQAHPDFPITIYYAFKQAETSGSGTASTGWETFIEALLRAGFAITGTWPMRTEKEGRVIGIETNALASSIVLVCRPRPADAPGATRRDFLAQLRRELPAALRVLQQGNIAPVDLAQAAIGPGMKAFSEYQQVTDADGKALTVRDALTLINRALDETLAEQDGDFDADTRWAVAWFEQFGFGEGAFGVAETLSKAKNVSIAGLEQAGLLESRGGRVLLKRPDELAPEWSPAAEMRLTTWEVTQYLVRAVLIGEKEAAALLAHVSAHADAARELAYRLYAICDRKKQANDAFGYNALVASWPEIAALAERIKQAQAHQTELYR